MLDFSPAIWSAGACYRFRVAIRDTIPHSIELLLRPLLNSIREAAQSNNAAQSRYLCVIVKTPSQLDGGSSNKYSWQRFQ